jgi:hypothetical protein
MRLSRLKYILLFLLLGNYSLVIAQVGGSYTYGFLTLTNSAKIAALGGKNVSLKDGNLNMAYYNPALLDSTMDQNLALNYVPYFAKINFGYASYALDVKKIGTFAIGVHYINHGDFIGAMENGEKSGTFTAAEYSMNLMFSRPIDSSFRWGVTLKPVYSHLEKYASFGLALDAGITYNSADKLTSVGLVVRNVGSQLKTYYADASMEPLPFEILLGVSQKLQYAPFRISLTAHNLQKFKMASGNTEEETSDFFSEPDKPSKFEKFSDNLLRHFIIGLEFLPSKSLFVAASYNYQRRKEMALKDSPGTVGFSFGAGLNLKLFSFAYGYSVYHAAGGSNHFSLTLNLSQFYHR